MRLRQIWVRNGQLYLVNIPGLNLICLNMLEHARSCSAMNTSYSYLNHMIFATSNTEQKISRNLYNLYIKLAMEWKIEKFTREYLTWSSCGAE